MEKQSNRKNEVKKLHFITNPAAAGLSLESIPGGVAVTGTQRDTRAARNSIEAHGATWNAENGRWEATDPAGVADLLAWFEPLPAPCHSADGRR